MFTLETQILLCQNGSFHILQVCFLIYRQKAIYQIFILYFSGCSNIGWYNTCLKIQNAKAYCDFIQGPNKIYIHILFLCVHLVHFNELLIMTNNKILFCSDAQRKERYPREIHLTAQSRHDQSTLTSFSSSTAWHASAHQMNQTDWAFLKIQMYSMGR